MTTHRVLVVEDDHQLREALARGLREEGFTVATAADGAQALRADPADAVVLDIGLPDSDGRDVCQALRARGTETPVIFLTARDALGDRLSGFSAGADDYLAKPVHVAELAARLQAVLRRSGNLPRTEVAGFVLDPTRHVLRHAGGLIPLTPTEFRLLARLMAEPGVVVRRHTLLSAGWPAGAQVANNTLDQYLLRLRAKIAELGGPNAIVTVRGVGYRFA
ncbi:MAG: response regulator transcription factor [Streptosporangiaceae bacterium]